MHIFWRLKFFTGDQTWTVSGQMATKEKFNLEGWRSFLIWILLLPSFLVQQHLHEAGPLQFVDAFFISFYIFKIDFDKPNNMAGFISW